MLSLTITPVPVASPPVDKGGWNGIANSSLLAALRTRPFDVQCDAFEYQVSHSNGSDGQLVHQVLDLVCQVWWEGRMTYSKHADESVARLALIQGFAELTRKIQRGDLSPWNESPHLQSARAPVVIAQMAARIMLPDCHRDVDAPPMETIARDYLSLRGLLALPWMQILEPELQAAIASRRQILIAAARDETNLSPVACSLVRVALATQPDHAPVSLDPQAQKQAKRLSQFAQYFARADYLSDQSSIAIKAAILEGSFYTTLLQSKRAACMFPMTESPEQDRYLQYIPVLITIPSTTSEGCYTPQWLFDLAQWSMYIFLVDEYMESVVVHFSTDELAQFCAGLELIHPYPDPGESIIGVPQLLSHQAGKQPLQNAAAAPNVQAALSVYYTWAREMLNWDRLSRCSATDMNELRSEIKKYLLFHAHQIQDNLRLADQLGRAPTQSNTEASVARFESPRTSFATWLHSVGAGHVSAPVSLAFLAAYMGSWVRNSTNGDDPHQRRDCWSSVMQRVLAHEMNQHVGAYCRLYNDYGSVQRDLREGNLNSVHFPEFWTHEIAAESERTGTDDCVARLKATLLQVGRHERRMAESLGDELYNSLEGEDNDQGSRIAGALRVYCRNAELFSDLYLTRDVTNSVK